MKIYLVRHAQSESNINPYILHKKTNMLVDLTPEGINQAHACGEKLKNIISKNSKIWYSPYLRTKRTKDIINQYLGLENTEESIYLSERQFGLIDTVSEYRHKYTYELNFYNMYKKDRQDFYVRPPGGESPFDVCLRTDYLMRTILDKDIETHICITHAAAIKCMIKMYTNSNYEDYDLIQPTNTSVYLLEHKKCHLIS